MAEIMVESDRSVTVRIDDGGRLPTATTVICQLSYQNAANCHIKIS
jgi:hypothetical protein